MVVQSLDERGFNLLSAVQRFLSNVFFLQVSNVLAEGEEVVCQVVADLIREFTEITLI